MANKFEKLLLEKACWKGYKQIGMKKKNGMKKAQENMKEVQRRPI